MSIMRPEGGWNITRPPVHPGEMLREEFMKPLGISISTASLWNCMYRWTKSSAGSRASRPPPRIIRADTDSFSWNMSRKRIWAAISTS